MTFTTEDRFEQAVRRRARAFGYPKAPDVGPAVRAALATRRRITAGVLRPRERQAPPISLSRGAVSRRFTSQGYGAAVEGQPRRLALLRAAALLVVVVAVLMAVPETRALISGWFRIGVINILPAAPAESTPNPSVPVTATPASATRLPSSLRDLSGLTTLQRAQQQSGFRIQLPHYPDRLGDPDLVFHQSRLDMVVLVWLDETDRDAVQLSLFEFLSSNPIVKKIDPTVLAETDVNGHPALWLEGPYPLEVRGGDLTWMRIVEGRSLVWESDGITYRLESLLTLEESLKIAESLR